jgi:hypothetical protein
MKRKILLVYAALNHPLRTNTQKLIECFREHSDDHWFYLNLAHKSAPFYLRSVDFDLIIFQTTFTQRLSRSDDYYRQMVHRAALLADLPAQKVALIQDEHWNVAKAERFVLEFGIRAVFCTSPPSVWPKLYPMLDPQKVRIHRVLTGYIEDGKINKMIAASDAAGKRTLDIVYRLAGRPDPSWGREGYIKQTFAEEVKRLAPEYGLKIDISADGRNPILGDDWYRFLASARYAIGVESGASLMDRDGKIKERVDAYLEKHPEATFDEIEAACFPGEDGNARIKMIGPRHLEACATKTCQILVRGEYNGLLQPDIHYIPVSPDMTDLPQVLAGLGNEERRQRIVQRAFDDIVAPRKISYESFVQDVLEVSLSGVRVPDIKSLKLREKFLLGWMRFVDRAEWMAARLFSKPVRKVRDALSV